MVQGHDAGGGFGALALSSGALALSSGALALSSGALALSSGAMWKLVIKGKFH